MVLETPKEHDLVSDKALCWETVRAVDQQINVRKADGRTEQANCQKMVFLKSFSDPLSLQFKLKRDWGLEWLLACVGEGETLEQSSSGAGQPAFIPGGFQELTGQSPE